MWKLFWIFSKVGLLMFGGGYSAHMLLEKELVKNQIIKRKEFLEIISIASAIPGPNSVIIATFVGRKYQGGFWGSFVAVLGILTPSVIILFILLSSFKMDFENETLLKILLGIRIAIIVIILKFMFYLIKQFTHWIQYVFFGIGVTLFMVYHISPIFILLILSLFGLLFYPVIYGTKLPLEKEFKGEDEI